MPLLEGSSQDIINTNIKQLRNDGFNEKQSVAIALKKAGKAKAADRAKKGVMAKKRNKVAVK